MTAEKVSKNIVELMKQPENIRNIGVCAHIDHGKCVKKDSRLLLANGGIMTAEKLFESAAKKGEKFDETEEHIIYNTQDLNIGVFSLNKQTGKLEKKPISLAWKLNGGKLINIKLRNGFTIATTPEHKFIIYNNFDFVEKEAHEIGLGDRVVCSRKLPTECQNFNIKEEILNRLKQKRFYVRLKLDFGKKIKDLVLINGIENISSRIGTPTKPASFYCGIRKYRYHINEILGIASLFEIPLEEVYDNIESIVYRKGFWRGKNSIAIHLPAQEHMESLYYAAGLMVGDGHHKKFIVGKEELGRAFVEICKNFGIQPTFRNYRGRTPEIVTNQTFMEVLNVLFDYPSKKKSHNVKISEFLQYSPKHYAAKFLQGYFDTDGGVEKGRRAITISSASNQMISDLSLFLLRFGCISIIEKDNTLSLSGISAMNFMSEIGFGLKEKEVKAYALINGVKGSLVADTIPIISQYKNTVLMRKQSGQIYDTFMKFCDENNVQDEQLQKILSEDIAYIEVKAIEVTEEEEVYDFTVPENHNFVAEGMIIHNTTFSDILLAGAGMISEELAGKQLALDFRADEQERGITIDSANVSMVHKLDDREFLINLIDTPGHIDFGGDVTRAMRAVDGAIVLVCAVEGMMPQTETVLKQALRERVKPILFINKVDRLIKEVKLTPEEMQNRFVEIIRNINQLIGALAPDEFKEKWKVNVQEGSVAFGSAFHKWALSYSYMQKTKLSFKDVIEAYANENYKELSKKAPLHKIVLEMSVNHHPNPVQAQAYRIPKIWHGEMESEVGKALINCDPNGPPMFVVTKIIIDKHAGEVAAGRLFSGTLSHGQEVYMNMAKRTVRLQQVSIYKGAQRIIVDNVPSGNIIGLVGLKNTFAGETISASPVEPFEAIKHIFEPVVTKSIDAKNSADLPKLIEVLKAVNKEDPSIKISINEETGENLMSGMGELHLEVIENRIRTEKGVDVVTSNPIVVYRETITKPSPEIEGKSPNKHNKFYFKVEPLAENIYQAIKAGELPEMRIKKDLREIWGKFVEFGMDTKEARKVKDIYNGNILVDGTRGIVQISEIMEMVMDSYEDVMSNGPIAREPCMKIKVTLTDAKLHEDAIHRGPAQVLPAVRDSIREAILRANSVIYEPLQVIQIDGPADFMGEISKLVQNKRGQLIDMKQTEVFVSVKAKLPVAEMFGLTSDLRSATSGRGSHFVVDQIFDKLPESLQQKITRQLRERKGLKLEETN